MVAFYIYMKDILSIDKEFANEQRSKEICTSLDKKCTQFSKLFKI